MCLFFFSWKRDALKFQPFRQHGLKKFHGETGWKVRETNTFCSSYFLDAGETLSLIPKVVLYFWGGERAHSTTECKDNGVRLSGRSVSQTAEVDRAHHSVFAGSVAVYVPLRVYERRAERTTWLGVVAKTFNALAVNKWKDRRESADATRVGSRHVYAQPGRAELN